MLTYVLGYRPDEFGLVPDENGFVPFKEMLKALHEEGWRHIRKSHINELLLSEERQKFDVSHEMIRSRERHWHLNGEAEISLPGLVYAPVRKKAHVSAFEKGIRASGRPYVVLSSDREMALRIGRRRDSEPVLLEVSTGALQKRGTELIAFGSLFLCSEISPECITGPRPSKDLLEPKEKKAVQKPENHTPSTGTFVLDSRRDPDRARRAKGKKRKGWKEEAKKMRRRHKA